MKLSRPATITALLLAILVLPALATEMTHPAGFSITFPDDWKTKAEDETLEASDKDEECNLVFYVPADAKTLDQELEELDKELEKFVKEIKIEGEPTKVKHNGMDAVFVDAKGKVEGHEVDLGIGIFEKSDGKMLVVFGIVPTALASKHEKALEGVLKSVKPKK